MIDDTEQDLLSAHRDFATELTKMIAEGRLNESDIPDDYEWLCKCLIDLAFDGDKLDAALEDE